MWQHVGQGLTVRDRPKHYLEESDCCADLAVYKCSMAVLLRFGHVGSGNDEALPHCSAASCCGCLVLTACSQRVLNSAALFRDHTAECHHVLIHHLPLAPAAVLCITSHH